MLEKHPGAGINFICCEHEVCGAKNKFTVGVKEKKAGQSEREKVVSKAGNAHPARPEVKSRSPCMMIEYHFKINEMRMQLQTTVSSGIHLVFPSSFSRAKNEF